MNARTITLQPDELAVIEQTLLRLIGEWDSQSVYHRARRDMERTDFCVRQSERLCLVYERVLGRSPLAFNQPVREAWAQIGVQAQPAEQLVMPDFDWQQEVYPCP